MGYFSDLNLRETEARLQEEWDAGYQRRQAQYARADAEAEIMTDWTREAALTAAQTHERSAPPQLAHRVTFHLLKWTGHRLRSHVYFGNTISAREEARAILLSDPENYVGALVINETLGTTDKVRL